MKVFCSERQKQFKIYLDEENYESPLQINTENYIKNIEVKVIPFGRYQKLKNYLLIVLDR